MAEGSIKTSRPLTAMMLGLAATLAVAAAHLADLDCRPELHALDLRLAHFPPSRTFERAVHVFIDDASLKEVGEWPWPHQQVAGLLEALEQAGAGSIVMDILFADPQALRFEAPSLDAQSPDARALGANPKVIFDDLALVDTLARHDNCFLAMLVQDPVPPSLVEQALHKVLLTRTTLDLDSAAAAVHKDPASVRFEFRAAQEQAIADRIQQVLRKQPKADFEGLWPLVLDGAEGGRQTREMDLARKAYLRQRALAELSRHALPLKTETLSLPAAGQVIPPLVHLTASAGRVGFVQFRPDADNVARRVPLLRKVEGRTFPQMAFAAALRELERAHGPAEVRAEPGRITVACSDGTRRQIPLDAGGNMLVRFLPRSAFRELSAASVYAIPRERESLDRNRRLSRLLHLDLAQKLGDFRIDAPDAQAEAVQWQLVDLRDKLVKLIGQADEIDGRLQDHQVRRQRALLYEPAAVPPAPSALLEQERQIEQKIDQACRDLTALLKPIRLVPPRLAPATQPADAARVREEFEKEKMLFDHVAWVRRTLETLEAEQPALLARVEAMLASLREAVEGRVVFLGSSASGSGAADFTPTPLDVRTPGVVVHANVLSTILNDRYVHQAPPRLNVLVILLAGAAMSLLTALYPVWATAPAGVLLGLAYAGFNATVVFAQWDTHLAVAAPLGAILASFLAVTAFRQLTEERAKREIRSICAKALSPELLDEVERDPSVLRLGGEKRVVSCLFSDLAGFTPLAERLGEQGTVRLLNRYFDRMTEVIQVRSGGYLNKFLGDGIFAFFGAPVPQEDHARRAIQAAVLCQIEVAALNAALARELQDPPRLSCRIGIATGEVIVGNCGSSHRMDYTAIGDQVNLASRLEGASKAFGTRILVSQAAWDSAGCDAACGRYLGQVLVVGKTEPVGIWAILHELPEDESALRKAFADFTRAVELYRDKRFQAAAELFEMFLQGCPHDRAALLYLKLCKQYQQALPDDWTPVIRLSEK